MIVGAGTNLGRACEVWAKGVAGEGVDVLGVEDFSHLALRLLVKLSNWCKSSACKICAGVHGVGAKESPLANSRSSSCVRGCELKLWRAIEGVGEGWGLGIKNDSFFADLRWRRVLMRVWANETWTVAGWPGRLEG